MYFRRTDLVVENQPTIQPTVDAAVPRVHSGEDAVIEDYRIQPDPDGVFLENLGNFDSNMSLYPGFCSRVPKVR